MMPIERDARNSGCTTAPVSYTHLENLEGKLVFWLRDYHHAETFKDPAKLPESSQQELHIVANCLECRGTGKSLSLIHI